MQGESYDYEVWTVGVDGSGLRQITNNHSMNSYPTFSPDGKAIYFMADRKRNGERELWRVGVDGSGARKMFPK
jgi:Tol biopolymer transport system component